MCQLINGKRSRAVWFEGKENGANTSIEILIWLDFSRRPSICKNIIYKLKVLLEVVQWKPLNEITLGQRQSDIIDL
jgi:hypothetical protein